MTNEECHNNANDVLENEIMAVIVVREQMQAALEALEVKLDRAKSEGASKQRIAELELSITSRLPLWKTLVARWIREALNFSFHHKVDHEMADFNMPA